MQNIAGFQEKLLACKPKISDYEKAIKEREETIRQCHNEIKELKKSFKEVFGPNIIICGLKFPRVSINHERLDSALINIITAQSNLLTKEIHEQILLDGFKVSERRIRQKLENLLKKGKIEKIDPEAGRNVVYRVKQPTQSALSH